MNFAVRTMNPMPVPYCTPMMQTVAKYLPTLLVFCILNFEIPSHFTHRLLCDRRVRVSALLPPHLGELLLHHDPAVTQTGSNISPVNCEVGKEKKSPGSSVDESPWKHQDSTPGHLACYEDRRHPDSHPLRLHHLPRVRHGGDDDDQEPGDRFKCRARDARMSPPMLFWDSARLESGR